jgi:uncharacterized protein (UPF0332 family)
MMDEKRTEYVAYKMQKAAQALKEAKLLMDHNMNETAASRLYYAAFYALTAYLTAIGLNPKSHTGAKSLLNKELIMTGKLESRYSEFYTLLMAKRHEADYENFAFVDAAQLPKLLEETEAFVHKMEELALE